MVRGRKTLSQCTSTITGHSLRVEEQAHCLNWKCQCGRHHERAPKVVIANGRNVCGFRTSQGNGQEVGFGEWREPETDGRKERNTHHNIHASTPQPDHAQAPFHPPALLTYPIDPRANWLCLKWQLSQQEDG